MSGGFIYMTDERVKQTQIEMVLALSDLKTKHAALQHLLRGWKPIFQDAYSALSNQNLPSNFTFASLPEKQEIVTAWQEFEDAKREIGRLQASIQKMGLNIS